MGWGRPVQAQNQLPQTSQGYPHPFLAFQGPHSSSFTSSKQGEISLVRVCSHWQAMTDQAGICKLQQARGDQAGRSLQASNFFPIQKLAGFRLIQSPATLNLAFCFFAASERGAQPDTGSAFLQT